MTDFWKETLDKDAIIIGGICYHDDGNVAHPVDTNYLGYGGARFHIRMNDGRVINTNNLWYNGPIPAEYAVHDNAVFVKE